MEFGHRQEPQMTEAMPKVYDIIHPTPVSLKELSAMTISLELWRGKVNEHRRNQQMKEFEVYRLRVDNTWIKSILPDLPSAIFKTITEFLSRFVGSVDSWLYVHHKKVFGSHGYQNYVLEYFNDFVCDYDGSINYHRTAERLMRCGGLNMMMKFMVACTYFLEDDIRRIWPSVSRHLSVDFISFHKFPQLCYWICYFRNELYKIPSWRDDIDSVEEKMLNVGMPYNRPWVEYFWNRIPFEKQMKSSAGIHRIDFVRFILPKLDERQLYEFANSNGMYRDEGFYLVFRHLHLDQGVAILRTWSYIKNFMSETTFTDLVVNLLAVDEHDCDEELDYKTWEYLCSEIWNDTPLNFKQSVIRLVSSESTWFENLNTTIGVDSNEIHVDFLMLILQDASIKERNSFWRNCWETLIEVVEIQELQRIMQLCFENDDEITEFKQNVIVKSRAAFQLCVLFFKEASFDELNAFVSFCYPELQSARNFKQQILQSTLLGGDCQLSHEIMEGSRKFSDFVNDAFDNIDESIDFRNLLMSSSSFMKRLCSIICSGRMYLDELVNFFDTRVSTDERVIQVKMILIDSLKRYVTRSVRRHRAVLFSKSKFNSILLWCLGNENDVEEFKSTFASSH